MKNSTQLFSTVSLLVLLSTMPDNLWAMTNEGTEGDGTATKTATVKDPEDKKDTPKTTSGGWWPFSWGSSAPAEDVKKSGTTTLTPQDAENAAEDLKEATLEAIGMTREDFEKADIEALRTQLQTKGLSHEQHEFLKDAIRARSQQEDLSASALQLVQADSQKLKQLQTDPELSPEIQKLVSSALVAQQKGGTQEEQAARVVKEAQSSPEWGWGATVAYYTLGAPVTIPHAILTGAYGWMFGANSATKQEIPVVDPLAAEKPNAQLLKSSKEPVDPEAITEERPAPQTLVPAKAKAKGASSENPNTVLPNSTKPVADGKKEEIKKQTRQQRRAAARAENKKRDAEQKAALHALREKLRK